MKILTQAQPKNIIADYQGTLRLFDITRSITEANDIPALFEDIHKRHGKRWDGFQFLPFIIFSLLDSKSKEFNFCKVSQENYTNMDFFNSVTSPDLIYGFHSIFSKNGKRLHKWKEPYLSAIYQPTFRNFL